jgi:hypothetical protein
MRFMILIKADEDTEAGVLPSQQLLTEMGAYNEQLVNAGVMVAGEGLHASSRGVVERYPYPRDRDAQYEIEIRPVFGAEDFGDVMTPELGEQEERLRARATELNLAATHS